MRGEGQCGNKYGGRLCGRLDSCISGGRGSEFQGSGLNRKWRRKAAVAAEELVGDSTGVATTASAA